MTPVYREYMLHKAKMDNSAAQTKRTNNQIINNRVMHLGTTTDKRITNMVSILGDVDFRRKY